MASALAAFSISLPQSILRIILKYFWNIWFTSVAVIEITLL